MVVYRRLPNKNGLGVANPFGFSEDYPLPYGCCIVPTSDFLSVQYPTRDFFSRPCANSHFWLPLSTWGFGG